MDDPRTTKIAANFSHMLVCDVPFKALPLLKGSAALDTGEALQLTKSQAAHPGHHIHQGWYRLTIHLKQAFKQGFSNGLSPP